MKNGNIVVFTDWYSVIVNTDNVSKEIAIPKFLRELEKKLESKEYNVFYNEKQKKFYITYEGIDYSVIFNNDEQKSLESNDYTPLILKLFWLTSLEKKYNDEKAFQTARKEKINSINNSNYEDIETIEDYELYLDYLKELLKKAKTQEEKNAINTKIVNIVQIVSKMKKEVKEKEENPLNLQMYINKTIYNVLKQVDKLNNEEKKEITSELRTIIVDFKKQVDDYNKKKNSGLFFGNPMVPMDILERIIDVEYKVKSLLKSKEISIFVDESLSGLESELNSIVHTNKG